MILYLVYNNFSCSRGHLTRTKPVRVITNTFTSPTMTVANWCYPCSKSIKETIERAETQTHFQDRFFKKMSSGPICTEAAFITVMHSHSPRGAF